MQELFAALLSFFLVEPLQAEIKERFGTASREAVEEAIACVREETPALIQRGSDDPWWVAGHIFQYWAGISTPEEIVAETTPRCAGAIRNLGAASRTSEGERQRI
jgi:hypothetical protein